MDDKFAKFHSSINKMRQKVIKAKGGENVQGLSEPVIPSKTLPSKKQTKNQEKE